MSRSLVAIGTTAAVAFATAGLVVVAPAASAADECANGVDVGVSAAREDLGSVVDAGTVTFSWASSLEEGQRPLGDDGYITVDAGDVGGVRESGALFGSSVAVGLDGANFCSLIAVGAPGAFGGAGAVYLFRLLDSGVAEPLAVLQQGSNGIAETAEPGDRFGASLTFNSMWDTYASEWLAVGAPGEDVGTRVDAGYAHVIPLGTLGDGDLGLQQGDGVVNGAAEAGDFFGSSMSMDTNGFSLAIGSPGEDVGSVVDAGAVERLPGSSGGLPGASGPGSTLTQNSGGVPSNAEAGDGFGSALSSVFIPGSTDSSYQLAIGAPGEDVGTAADAGTVTLTYQTDGVYFLLTQGAFGAGGAAEAGDRFGAAVAGSAFMLAVGAPGEDIGTTKDAGSGVVFAVYNEADGYPADVVAELTSSWSQDTAGIIGTAETNDRFGSSVAFGLNGVVFGVPGENSTKVNEGAVNAIPYDQDGVLFDTSRDQYLTQSSAGFPGTSETGDGLGSGIASLT